MQVNKDDAADSSYSDDEFETTNTQEIKPSIEVTEKRSILSSHSVEKQQEDVRRLQRRRRRHFPCINTYTLAGSQRDESTFSNSLPRLFFPPNLDDLRAGRRYERSNNSRFGTQRRGKCVSDTQNVVTGRIQAKNCVRDRSSLRDTFSNKQQDSIRSAFSTSSFVGVRGLCTDDDAFGEETKSPIIMSQYIDKRDVFSSFAYVSSPLSLASEQLTRERIQSKSKHISKYEFSPCGAFSTDKYHGFAKIPDRRLDYAEDPYDGFVRKQRRERANRAASILHGAFVPAGGGHRMDPSPHPNSESESVLRGSVAELLNDMRLVVSKDWRGHDVEVRTRGKHRGLVAVSMCLLEESSAQTMRALIAYFDTFVKRHRLSAKFRLRKCPRRWAVETNNDGRRFVTFAFRLPWYREAIRSTAVIETVPLVVEGTGA